MSKKKATIEVGKDIKRKYLVGGTWKSKKIAKQGKASRTTSKPARLYIAVPPVTGWPGGLPENNGWKPGGGK